MNIIRIDSLHTGDYKNCTANGPGFRVVLWCSGCDVRCPGCHNSEFWSFKTGKQFTDKDLDVILAELDNPFIDGLTLLGGEPFSDRNIDDEIKVCTTVRNKFPDKTIWAYSGRTLEELQAGTKQKLLLDLIDILVDGPFIAKRRNISLRFRGSDNQRILKKTNGRWEEISNDF